MRLIRQLIQFVYPEPVRCLSCEQGLQGWQLQFGMCSECFSQLEFFQGSGLREAPWLGEQYFDLVHGVALYQGLVKELIYRFKYFGERKLGHSLVELMLAQYPIAFAGERWDGIVSVPLHQEKLYQRGFNQSQILAEGLAFYLGIPWYDFTERVRETLPQNQLKPGERAENLRGAFQVKPGSQVAGRKLLIVDDIFTTGSTCNELARGLKEAGATRVGVYTVASGRMM